MKQQTLVLPRILPRIVPALCLLACVLAAAWSAAPADAGDAETVRLKNGQVYVGEIIEHDDETITLRRLDTGGRVTIRWSDIHPEDAARLRRSLGLEKDEDTDRWGVEGVLVRRVGGGEVRGLLESEDDEGVTVRVGRSQIRLLHDEIEAIDPVRLDPRDLWSREEAMERRVAEHPPETAADHLELADYALFFEWPARALEHLEAALEALPDDADADERAALEERIAATRATARRAAADAALEAIRGAAESGDFDGAETALEAVLERGLLDELAMSEEDLRAELEAARREWDANKREILRTRITEFWYERMAERIEEYVDEDKVTLQAAREWAVRELSTALFEQLADEFDMAVVEIQKIWDRREVGDVQEITYGSGSWIIDGTRRPRTGGMGSRGERIEYEKPVAEEWWAEAKDDVRAQWLTAYYVERQLDVVDVIRDSSLHPCPECEGEGLLGGDEICPACYGLKYERVVRYR